MDLKFTIKEDQKEFVQRHADRRNKRISVFKDSPKMKEMCDRHVETNKRKIRLSEIKSMVTQEDLCRYHLVLYKDGYYDYLKDTKILELKSKSVHKVLVKCNSEILGQFLFPMSLKVYQGMFKLLDKRDLINLTGYMYHTPEGIYDDLNHSTVIESLSQLLTIYIEQETFNYIGSEVLELDKEDPTFLSICFDKVNKILDRDNSTNLAKYVGGWLNKDKKDKDNVTAISLDREIGKWSYNSKWKLLSGPSLIYIKLLNIFVLCNGDKLDDLCIIDKHSKIFFDSKLTANSYDVLSEMIGSGRLDTSDSADISSELLMKMYNDATIVRFGFNKKIKDVGDRLLLLFIVPMIYNYYDVILEENMDEIEIYAQGQMEYIYDLFGFDLEDDEHMESATSNISKNSLADYYVNFFINDSKKSSPGCQEGNDLRNMIILPIESRNISRMDEVKLSIRDLAGMRLTMSNGTISFKKKYKAIMLDDTIKIY